MLSEHSIQLLMEIYQLHENMAGSEDEPDSLKYWEKDPISAGFTLKTFSEVRNIQPDMLSSVSPLFQLIPWKNEEADQQLQLKQFVDRLSDDGSQTHHQYPKKGKGWTLLSFHHYHL